MIAVGCRDGGALAEAAVARVVNIEVLNVLTADHIRTQQIVILIRHAGQDLIVKARDVHVSLQIRARRVHTLGRALGRIHAAGQVAGF